MEREQKKKAREEEEEQRYKKMKHTLRCWIDSFEIRGLTVPGPGFLLSVMKLYPALWI